jgi:cell division septal protein FtsQ
MRAAVVLTVLISAGYGGWRLTGSSLFHLSGIAVAGARTLSTSQVIAASGLRIGQPMLGLDLTRVADRVEQRLPELRSVHIDREGSTHVRIVVVERSAALVLATPAGRWALDDAGHVIGPAGSGAGLPVVQAAALEQLPSPAANAVHSVWDSMDRATRAQVSGFQVSPQGDVSFALGGAAVTFGGADRIADKLVALLLVQRRVHQEGKVLYAIDVRAPDRPSARTS